MTSHFTLQELTHSGTAKRLGIDNVPTSLIRLNRLACLLEQIRHVLGDKPMTITSAYRCPKLNKAVGGVSNSAHVLGLAADFLCPQHGDVKSIVKAIHDSCLTYDQIIEEHSGSTSWVHIGLREDNWRRETLLYKDGSYYKW